MAPEEGPVPGTYSVKTIPSGAAGTRVTLQAMERMAAAGTRDPVVVLFAQELVRNGPEYGKMAEVDSILAGVRRSMRYTPDPLNVETVKAPSFSVREIKAHGRAVMDCDDASTLAASLIRSVGIPTRFKVIKDSPTEFTHVYLEALIDGRWTMVDPIAREMPLGRGPEGLFGSAYYEGGRMYKGMGASPIDALTTAISQVGQGYAERLRQKYMPENVSTQEVKFRHTMKQEPAPQASAPAFPWAKVALVAAAGLGVVFVVRALRKRR